MNKFLCCFFLCISLFAAQGYAQQDTSMQGKSWSDMQIVDTAVKTDTLPAAAPAKTTAKTSTDTAKVAAVDEKDFIKDQVKELCAKNMYGRGYVKDGWDTAAKYILKKFKEYKLQPVVAGGPYAQGFAFPVNTFPDKMTVIINKDDSLAPGIDFMVDAGSASYSTDSTHKLKVKKVNLGKVKDSASLASKLASMDSTHAGTYAYYLKNIDEACEKMEMRQDQLVAMLPKGCYIIADEDKLTWSVSRKALAATVLYIRADSLPKKLKNVSLDIKAIYNEHQRSENIIACAPGQIKDSFIVFTAHYDHLGMMGRRTPFQGASDNASGVGMLLYLASYYAKHPQKYSMLFIAFGAEEASLMGSEFFVWHPFVPLKSIKFLTNIDIMSDATNGITVVNAIDNGRQFAMLERINEQAKYIRAIIPRENAANSDHYYFSKMKVPCMFIYSNGGRGYYRDVNDVKTTLSLNHVDDVARLLIDFVRELN